MCRSMVDIQSPTAKIRRGKKKKKKKKQDENIMVCPITYGDHNYHATLRSLELKPKFGLWHVSYIMWFCLAFKTGP